MDESFSAKLKHNAETALRSGSTWVFVIGGAILAYYLRLSDEDRIALEAAFPLLKGWTPVLTWVATWLVARLKPSNAVSTQTQALIDELTRLKLDEELRKRGIARPPVAPASQIRAESSAPPMPAIAPAAPPRDLALEALRALAPTAQADTLAAALRLLRSGRADFDPTTGGTL